MPLTERDIRLLKSQKQCKTLFEMTDNPMADRDFQAAFVDQQLTPAQLVFLDAVLAKTQAAILTFASSGERTALRLALYVLPALCKSITAERIDKIEQAINTAERIVAPMPGAAARDFREALDILLHVSPANTDARFLTPAVMGADAGAKRDFYAAVVYIIQKIMNNLEHAVTPAELAVCKDRLGLMIELVPLGTPVEPLAGNRTLEELTLPQEESAACCVM